MKQSNGIIGIYLLRWVLLDDVLPLRKTKDQVQHIVVVLDGLLCQRFAIRLAVVVTKPPQVLRDANTCDFFKWPPFELRDD